MIALQNVWRARRMRPAPPELPARGILGHLRPMRDEPLAVIAEAHRLCGDVARVRMGPLYVWLIFHPDLVERVLVDNAANYRKQTRGYDKLRFILGDGLVTSEGSFWKRQRRIAQPSFHRQRIAAFADTMVRAAMGLSERWEHAADAGTPVDVADDMTRLTLRVVGETLLGLDISGDSDVIGSALTRALTLFAHIASSPLPFPEYAPTANARAFRRAATTLDRVVTDIVQRRRRSGEERSDLLGMFMAARDEETGEGMTDRQLRDEVLTMLLAGHETTANALAWSLWLISEHPEVAQRLEAEVDEVLAGRAPGMEDLARLTYTRMVLQEGMRLYPPVWILGRRAEQDDVLGGYPVAAGTYVYFSAYAIHRHPAFWPEPERFDPERFTPERVAERPRYAYFPFSGGQRQCIGDRFAEMEATLVLATLVQRFRVSLVPGHTVVPENTLTLRPRDGLPMRVARR